MKKEQDEFSFSLGLGLGLWKVGEPSQPGCGGLARGGRNLWISGSLANSRRGRRRRLPAFHRQR